MHVFGLFKWQLKSWIFRESDCADYLLAILREDGFEAVDCWVPEDVDNTKDPKKFHNDLKSTRDNKTTSHVNFYELEDIKKGGDETQISDGSDATIDFKHQYIPGKYIQLWKEILKSSVTKVFHIYASQTYYATQSIMAVMQHCLPVPSATKKKQLQKTAQCQNCKCPHPPGCNNCVACDTICKGCFRKLAYQVPQLWYCAQVPLSVMVNWKKTNTENTAGGKHFHVHYKQNMTHIVKIWSQMYLIVVQMLILISMTS